MAKVTVDGVEVEVPNGSSVMAACEAAGAEIPRFCYHERLSVAGNCRMCLVEVKPGPPKPQASCALPVNEGMEIFTKTETVKKAREGVMEFLLINHPLDCPICDQGGECDLQDQAMAYGKPVSRFDEMKNAIEDKNMGPLIKTAMTRCIQCSRCVRFSAEVTGLEELGLAGRGESGEITTYLEQSITSELSGNMIDLCPVGALTSKPYAFNARPWELKKTESIDVMDAVGSNIRVDVRGREVMRVLPRLHEDVNEEWISDKSRFIWDGLRRQRLDRPYVRRDGKLEPASWAEAFDAIKEKASGTAASKVAAIAGDLAPVEAMKALKDLMTDIGCANIDCRQDGAAVGDGARSGYLFNSGIAGIEEADAILIVGANPRWEASVLNARILKRTRDGNNPVRVGLVGENVDLTYPVEHLGAGPQTLSELVSGTNAFSSVLKEAEKPLIIVGMGALARKDGAAVLAAVRSLAESVGAIKDGWNGFNVLHTAASRVGGLDLGFMPGEGGKDIDGILAGAMAGDIEMVYLLGADEIDMEKLGNAFVIYQGSHGDKGAHRADVILPGAAYTEETGLFVNVEGRVQATRRASFPPGEAKENWAIIRALSEVVGHKLPYDTQGALRAALIEVVPSFGQLDVVPEAEWGAFGTAGDMDSNTPFGNVIDDFYMTNPIARASETMAECSSQFVAKNEGATGTHG